MTLKKIYGIVDRELYGMEEFILFEKETDRGRMIHIIIRERQGSSVRARCAASELTKKYEDEGLIFRSMLVDNIMCR